MSVLNQLFHEATREVDGPVLVFFFAIEVHKEGQHITLSILALKMINQVRAKDSLELF